MDPDQAWHFVGPDLGPNYMQKLSADNTIRQRVKAAAIGLHTLYVDILPWNDSIVSSVCLKQVRELGSRKMHKQKQNYMYWEIPIIIY